LYRDSGQAFSPKQETHLHLEKDATVRRLLQAQG
jgi:hypothetical protein